MTSVAAAGRLPARATAADGPSEDGDRHVLRYPVVEDDRLEPVSHVEWVSDSTFLVTVPAYHAVVSCELTAVEVPRLADDDFFRLVGDIVKDMNTALRCFLRQDFYSNFPLQAYGDVLYSHQRESPAGADGHSSDDDPAVDELQWRSLQEELLEAGIGCVTRPSPLRCEALFCAEDRGASPARGEARRRRHPWLAQLRAREQWSVASSTLGHAPARSGFLWALCTVEDVVSGDVFVVRWADAGHAAELPPLVILDATACAHADTAVGFRALRWSQRHLMGQTLRVLVHSRHPCDKDITQSTQLTVYEQLAHVRVTAMVVRPGAGAASPDELVSADVGVCLLREGLATIRTVAAPGIPRASNYRCLCTEAVSLAAAEAGAGNESTTPSDGVGSLQTLRELLALRWSMSMESTQRLLDFSGRPWRAEVLRHARVRRELRAVRGRRGRLTGHAGALAGAGLPGTAAEESMAATVMQSGLTKRLWFRHVYCSDLTRDPMDEPRTILHRPLRTLLGMETVAGLGCCRLAGYLSALALVEVPPTVGEEGERVSACFLRLELTLVNSSELWSTYRRLAGVDTTAVESITFMPDPADEVVYEGRIPLTVEVDEETEPGGRCQSLKVACKLYSLAEFRGVEQQLLRRPHFSDTFTEVSDSVYTTTLVLPSSAGATNTLFVYVVDVEATLSERRAPGRLGATGGEGDGESTDSGSLLFDEGELEEGSYTLWQRAVYYLRHAGTSGGLSESDELAELPVGANLLEEAVIEIVPRDAKEEIAGARLKEQSLPQTVVRPGQTRDSLTMERGSYSSRVFFYMEVPPKLRTETHPLLRQLSSSIFADVSCLPVGVGEVDGVRGFLGDVLLSPQGVAPPRSTAAAWSVLAAVVDAWRVAGDSTRELWGLSSVLPSSMSLFYTRERAQLTSAEAAAREALTRSLSYNHLTVLQQAAAKAFGVALSLPSVPVEVQVGGDPAAPPDAVGTNALVERPPLARWAGARVEWRDARALTTVRSLPHIPPSVLPPTAPLFLFSVLPRQLFAANADQHKRIAKELTNGHGETHMDWAFFRLRLPSLPQLLREDVERLPRSLRNAERAYCGALRRGLGRSGAAAATPSRPLSPELHELHAAEKPFVALLTLLFLLRDGEDRSAAAAVQPGDHPELAELGRVYELLDGFAEPLFSAAAPRALLSDAVVYVVPTPVETGTRGDGVSSPSPAYFLGSLYDSTMDALEPHPPDSTGESLLPYHRLVRWLGPRTLAAAGFEALTMPAGDCGVRPLTAARRDRHRTMLEKGLGPDLLESSTPVAYHPLGWLTVLGDPLVARAEWSAATLVAQRDVSADGGDGNFLPETHHDEVERVIGLRYVPLRQSKMTQPYRMFSYGRVDRKFMDDLRRSMETRFDSLKCYLSLLLRRPPTLSRASRFADGQLTVYGTALDPLVVHYRSRKDLRFSLGSVYPTLRGVVVSPPGVRGPRSAVEDAREEAEHTLVRTLCEAARTAVGMIVARLEQDAREQAGADGGSAATVPNRIFLRSSLQWLGAGPSDGVGASLHVKVYPVDLAEAERGRLGTPQGSGAPEEGNPHRPFELFGVVLRRLPRHELVIRHRREADAFSFSWNAAYERGSPSRAQGGVAAAPAL